MFFYDLAPEKSKDEFFVRIGSKTDPISTKSGVVLPSRNRKKGPGTCFSGKADPPGPENPEIRPDFDEICPISVKITADNSRNRVF